MLKTIIKVNGLYFAGELEECYKSSFKGAAYSFRDYKDNRMPKLKLVKNKDEAKIIEGTINLKSDIDRVMQRVRDRYIDLKKLEVINVE